jgi:uncharacterized protein GlcG (DUF336 family)
MIIQKPTISSDVAMRLAQAAVAHAKDNGWTIAVSVVDASGGPLASWRMDQAVAPVATYATDKAYTAAMFGTPSAALAAEMDVSPGQRMGFQSRDRYLVWGGGLPIRHKGVVVGGIGVSGAKDFEDIACAEVALAAEGFDTTS